MTIEDFKRQGLIYLASPYSHDESRVRDARFIAVCRAAAALMREGYLIFSPIAHAHPIAQHGLPLGWEFWRDFDEQFLTVCSAMLLLELPGWERSTGVAAEEAIMVTAGKPVFHLPAMVYVAADELAILKEISL